MRNSNSPTREGEAVAGPSSMPSSAAVRKESLIESDDGSGSNSHRSLTPLPKESLNYAIDGKMISSSDTLRLMSSPLSLPLSGSPIEPPSLDDSSSDEAIFQDVTNEDVDPILRDGVAVLAAKNAGETISTKRVLIASMSSPQQGWEILQGNRDEQVEEQVNILGLEMRNTQDLGGAACDISRTSSQSTTGTEKSASGSYGTAASSLQSAPSSDTALHEKDLHAAPAEEIDSPKLFITACSSNDDLLLLQQQRRDDTSCLRRYHALLELVETEAGYAEDLHSLVNVFFQNLTSQAFFDESDARFRAVCRNATDLLELHSALARRLIKIIDDCQISQESEGSDMDKALRCEEAIIQVAQQLTSAAPRFSHYQLFCSRHAEALLLIREAEKRHNGDDFAAFERMCGNQIRGHAKGSRQANTPSRRSSGGSSTPLGGTVVSFATAVEDSLATPGSGSTTPSGSFASVSRRTSGRLLFADYLIKPIQRLCLYPLVLNSLHRYTPEDQLITRKTLESAIAAMRKVADNVDKASKQREVDLMAELLLVKVEPHQGLPVSFLKSLGSCMLSGTLDVLYHHDVLCPLAAPLRFHRMGLILWNGFLLIVRVRKNQQLDCKYWLPLATAQITPLEETASPGTEMASWTISTNTNRPLVPYAMRLSSFGHHFELSALNEKERNIWHKRLSLAIQESPSSLEALPCSLPSHLNSTIHFSASASLFNFFANNARASSSSSSSIESLVRLSSASTRASVDRNMIFSEELLSQSGFNGISHGGGGYGPVAKDAGEALIAQQIRQSATPSIGSAVGAAMGLARMAATQVPTAVKRSRRQSMLNLTEIKPTCDVLLNQTPGEFSAPSSSSNSPLFPSLSKRGSIASFKNKDLTSAAGGESNDNTGNSKWKSTLLRRNSRALSMRNTGGSQTCSPMTSTTDLSQTLRAESVSPSLDDGFTTIVPVKPPHVRSRSSTLREVWQNSIGKRGRTQSANAQYIDMPGGLDGTTASSLTSSPLASPSLDSGETTASSSVAHLRRILSTTSAHSGMSLTRAKASGSRLLSSNGSNDGASSPLRTTKRGQVERSKTEIAFPALSYNTHDRRRSEPDALAYLERRKSTHDKSLHPLRRLTRKLSMVGPSSPTTSVVDHASSSMSALWTVDHSRLNSVEEHTIENSLHKAERSSTNLKAATKTTRADLPERRSSAHA